ncbi:MAG: hypothetical protein K0B00_05375 [Rhodobacteraceae bacterium]|nr:hypothetical protein [Paracoccaceae bacterium]
MRTFGTTTSLYLASREGVMSRLLIWVRARNRATGAEEALGLWTGDDHRSFTIDGATRLYYGAGGVLGIEPITMQTGIVVRMHRVTLAPTAPEVAQALRTYDARLAPVEIHRAFFAPASGELIEAPHRVFKGWIDAISLPTPEVGGQGAVEVTLASSARALTKVLALKKSDESQRRRGDDRIRRYTDISGSVDVYWGETKAKSS